MIDESKVALVTGGSRGIGRAGSIKLAESGFKIVVNFRTNEEAANEVVKVVENMGGHAIAIQADVSESQEVDSMFKQVLDSWGRVDVLVNNAGIDQPPGAATESHQLHEIPADMFSEVLNVNVAGAFLVSQVFGEEMVRCGNGSIINIGSLYASVSPDARLYDHIDVDPPFLKPPAYGASKAGLVNLTKYLATHWGPYGVRVNALSPGGVLGDQDEQFKDKFVARVPLGRMAEEPDLIGPLLFLASDASSYVTGTELRIDGGFTAW